MKRYVMAAVAGAGLLAVAATQNPAQKPAPMTQGKRYICILASEKQRTVEPIEYSGANWVKCKYSGEGRPESVVWLNLNQITYFEPEPE